MVFIHEATLSSSVFDELFEDHSCPRANNHCSEERRPSASDKVFDFGIAQGRADGEGRQREEREKQKKRYGGRDVQESRG